MSASEPLCSVLIPSRARPERLARTIAAFRALSPPGACEYLVRADDDDPATSQIVAWLEREHGDVRGVIGPRGTGYLLLSRYYAELSAVARAPWIWIMNDDAYPAPCRAVAGAHPQSRERRARWDAAAPWHEQLAAQPTTGVIVQAELYKLGGSGYYDCDGSAFPIVPRDAWKQAGHAEPCEPIDTWLDQALRVGAGWRTAFLSGVAVVHERDDDATLAEHRKI